MIQSAIEPLPKPLYPAQVCGLCRFEIYAGEDCYATELGYVCRECLGAYLQSIKEVAELADQ